MNWIKENCMRVYKWMSVGWRFMAVMWIFPFVIILVPWLSLKLMLLACHVTIAIVFLYIMRVESKKRIAEITADTERLTAEYEATILRIAELNKRDDEHPLPDSED